MATAALVTGAGQRIGRAIALELARVGRPVAVHYNASADSAAKVAAEIGRAGGKAVAIRADLADAAALPRLIADAGEALGPVGILVNNASIFEPDDAAILEPKLWDLHMAINLRAPVFLARHMAAALPDEETGVVVNIVDQRVIKPTPDFFSYGVAKSALWSATRMLAQALAPHIRVNAVGPGPTAASARQSDDDFRRQHSSMPLGHGPAPEEIAAAVRYLVEAPSVTGQLLLVDGGQHLAWQTADVVGIRE